MISIFFTGLGPGGLRKAVNFNLDLFLYSNDLIRLLDDG